MQNDIQLNSLNYSIDLYLIEQIFHQHNVFGTMGVFIPTAHTCFQRVSLGVRPTTYKML